MKQYSLEEINSASFFCYSPNLSKASEFITAHDNDRDQAADQNKRLEGVGPQHSS